MEVAALQATVSKLREEVQRQKELVQERDQLVENIEAFLSSNNLSGSATEEEEAAAIEEAAASSERAANSFGGARSLSTGMAPRSASLLKKADESAQKYENTPGVAMDSTPFVSSAPLAFSPQFLGVKEGLELVYKSLQYVCREENIMREYMLTEQGLLVKHLDATLVGLLKYRTEVAHLHSSKTYLTDQIDDLQRKVETKAEAEEKATRTAREVEGRMTEMSGDYALAKESIKHFDIEKASMKILLDKTKADAQLLSEKLEASKRENTSLCEQSEKFVSDMLAAQAETRDIVQKLCIVEAERDELKKQFITNAHLPVTSQFTDKKYNLPPNSSRVFVPSRSSSILSNSSGDMNSPGGGLMVDMGSATPRESSMPFSPAGSSYSPRAQYSNSRGVSPPVEHDPTVVPPGIAAFVDSYSLNSGTTSSLQSPLYKRSSGSSLSVENLHENTRTSTSGSSAVFASANRISSNSGTITGVHTSGYKTPLSAKYM